MGTKGEERARKFAAFEEKCAALQAAGYAMRDKTVSIGRANWLGLLSALPFAAAGLVAAFLIPHNYALVGFFWADLALFFAALFVSIPVHEGLHALFWAAANGTFRGLSFGIAQATPYCACETVMSRGKYLLGSLAPFLLLGGGLSAAGLCLSNVTLAAVGAYNVMCAGGDLLVAYRALFCRAEKLLDHPVRCGFYAFYREKKS